MSFYYWNPTFTLDSAEGDILQGNDVHTLYIRYFDVNWTTADSAPGLLTSFIYAMSPAGYTIIPVVSIRNRVFEKLTLSAVPAFAADIYARVKQINETRHLRNEEIQFDCDWSARTRENYFSFLREYRRISGQSVSSAIRMFQLRYAGQVGVPPVDHGVLFFFNLEDTDSGNERSIYERTAAHHYTPSLRSYPLTLDVALPLFNAAPDSLNTHDAPDARNALDGEDLFEIITDVNRHSNHHIRNLIFFDLNRDNLTRYDPNVFREALARFN
jgi:hypothetical protein